MPWTDRLPAALQGLAALGVADGDSEDLRLDKAMLTLLNCLMAVMSFAWIAIYLAVGLPRSAAVPAIYQLCVVATLVAFHRTKSIHVIRPMLLSLMVVLPFVLQWSLGGFENGSAVAAWAGITPVLAYLFGDRTRSWLVGFIGLLAFSSLFETRLAASAPSIGAQARAALFTMNLAGPSIAAFLALLYFTSERDRTRAELAQEHALLGVERARSERLLLNILPAAIADQLREGATSIAESHADVSVLFADIVDFTPLAEELGARALVDLLNEAFTSFDDLVAAAGLEKIKTIGDSYMVAGGLPTPDPDHLISLLNLAVDMSRAIGGIRLQGGESLQLRIGVDAGPVVAGVIGRRKFSYDIWGDTVNMASRMESHGVPGRIHVTERVAAAARQHFEFESRGPLEVKGKGPVTTFLLVSAR